MSDFWKTIVVKVEPRDREFRIGIQPETKVEDVLEAVVETCEEEGISLRQWGQSKIGNPNINLVVMRKSLQNTILPPQITFGELLPELEDDELFHVDAQGQVG